MDSTPVQYEERHGWSRSVALTVSIGGVVGVASLVGFGASHLIKLLLLGLILVLGSALNAAIASAQRLTIRVDERGLTLAKAMLRTPSGGETAWPQVRSVVIRRVAGRTYIGIVKLHADIPATSVTDSGTPKPDIAVLIAGSGFDSARFIEAVHGYAPEVAVVDERPTQVQGTEPAQVLQRTEVRVGLAVVVIGVAILGIAAVGDSAAGGYTVQAGSAGTPADLTLPQQIGPRELLTTDDPYLFKYEPALLPSGASSTYGTIAASYWSADKSDLGIAVDGIYASGAIDHRAVFSSTPQALADLATSTLFPDGAQSYRSGTAGAVLECGEYGDQPQCVWADQSDFIFVSYDGIPGTMADLVALTPTYAAAMEGRS